MKTVTVTKQVRVEKAKGFAGSIKVEATPKLVTVFLTVNDIPEGGGKITLYLPWGKISGIAKSAQPAKEKGA